jgi:hypothetical protein
VCPSPLEVVEKPIKIHFAPERKGEVASQDDSLVFLGRSPARLGWLGIWNNQIILPNWYLFQK